MVTVRGTDGWLYRQEFTRCNKPGCKRCERGPGHGPYWYKFRREEGRLVKKYVGKTLPRYVEDESAVQKALQKKTAVQLCPNCGKPLGDDLAELVGFEGLIYHKTCREEGPAHPTQSTVPDPRRRTVTENEAGSSPSSQEGRGQDLHILARQLEGGRKGAQRVPRIRQEAHQGGSTGEGPRAEGRSVGDLKFKGQAR